MVFEGRGDSRRVLTQEIQTARFGNSRGVALLPLYNTESKRWRNLRLLVFFLPLSLILLLGTISLWQRNSDPKREFNPVDPVIGTTVSSPVWSRRPKNDEEMRFWLENMIVRHNYSIAEVESATGMGQDEIVKKQARLNIRDEAGALKSKAGSIEILPYPGGRHPRLGELHIAINPQRDTKFSVFTPWSSSEYAVVDLPEAIMTDKEMIYLAHTDSPTRWSRMNVHLSPLEWDRSENGDLSYQRDLPDGSAFGASVTVVQQAVKMEMWVSNGTLIPMRGLWAQICVLPARVTGFTFIKAENSLLKDGYTLCRGADSNRWIITAWQPLQSQTINPEYPSFRSDPNFGDCEPGETVRARGWLSFYQGDDVGAELTRIEATGWRWEL